jgi:hypothetical protein
MLVTTDGEVIRKKKLSQLGRSLATGASTASLRLLNSGDRL